MYPQLRAIVGDHAHNEILNVGVELGLVGVALVGVFLVLLVRRVAKRTEEGSAGRWQRALLAGTIGMLAQSCFSPSLRSWDVAPFFWTQIGLLMAMARTGQGDGLKWVQCRAPCRGACVGVLIAVAIGGVVTEYRDWRGEVLLGKGMVFDVRDTADARAAGPHLEQGAALIMNPVWWYNAKFRYAVSLRRSGRPDDAIRVLEEIDREVPNLGATRLYLGELYFDRFRKGGMVADQDAALSNLNGYLSANANPGGYLLAAKVLLTGKPRRETVIHYLERCLAFRPSKRQRAEAERLLNEVRKVAQPPR